jgi:hypothetical protein
MKKLIKEGENVKKNRKTKAIFPAPKTILTQGAGHFKPRAFGL